MAEEAREAKHSHEITESGARRCCSRFEDGMGERKLIQQRCLAVQLVRKEAPISPASGDSSSSGDTTTPVNDPATATPASTNHQDGHHLFRMWQAANVECTWDKELVEAARAVQYLGHLVGGVVLVGGPTNALATLSLAWSRSLLAAPSGYSLTMIGEVQGWNVAVVPQGQFTPLADALCWVVHHLTREGCKAGAEAVREALEVSFPTMMSPSPSHVHATLSSLIQQCKVYYTGATYGIVQPGTYCPTITPPAEAPVLARDGLVSTAAQTDLAELITGAAHASDTVITPTQFDGMSGRQVKEAMDTMHSSHHQLQRNHHHHSSGRAASLRLSPTRVSLLATHFGAGAAASIHTYQAQDFSDISIRGERGSVFSKLLRVPGRRRIASFAAQFPPPEWSDSDPPIVHLHSVAVQTSSKQGEVKAWHLSTSQWTPRSATLPRRLRRPHSSTPPLPESQHSSPIPRGFTSLLYVHTSPHQGASRPHGNNDRKGRNHNHQSPVHRRSESRSYRSSSSEDFAHPNQLLPPVVPNLSSKRNQSDNLCHKGKELGVVSTNMVVKPGYNHQSVDPSRSEERLLEMLQDCHVKGDKSEITDGKQQRSKQKQEKGGHKYTTNHPAHNKYAKSKKHKPESRFDKNQQGGNSKPTMEDSVHAITHDDTTSAEKERASRKTGEFMQSESSREKQQYQRASLHLDLTSDHMNNCRKVVASPQRPCGITTNLLHQTPDIQHITKGSTPDLTSRNLGFQDVDKCHKKMCTQTLDQVQRPDPPSLHNGKQVMSPGSAPEEREVGHDKRSVSTYPSLTELNLTFSSLAAQKILSGASVNSLDTLAEVNLAALKRNTNSVAPALTNTDLGFV